MPSQRSSAYAKTSPARLRNRSSGTSLTVAGRARRVQVGSPVGRQGQPAPTSDFRSQDGRTPLRSGRSNTIVTPGAAITLIVVNECRFLICSRDVASDVRTASAARRGEGRNPHPKVIETGEFFQDRSGPSVSGGDSQVRVTGAGNH
jgi:hypothetical protein